jgi:undecaprenyl-diphosphatase
VLGIRRGQLARLVYLAFALTTVGLLTRAVKSGKTAELDAEVTLALQRRTNPIFVRMMHLASWAGFPPQSRTLPLAIPAAIALLGSRFDALFQLAGWGTSIISGTLKTFMQRPRPVAGRFRVTKARIGGTSFPSGHVINYTGVYGMLAFLAGERISNPRLRRLVRTFLYTKIALVGPSRIYLGHHWFTDVVTSYLLGSSYLICLTAIYRRLRRRKQI